MKRLSKEDIKKLPDVPSKELEIPEWNCSILLQGISKAMQIELGRIATDDDKDAFEYQKELLKVCIVEPDLDEKDIDELYEKDSQTIDKIFLAINDLNGIGGSGDLAEQFSE